MMLDQVGGYYRFPTIYEQTVVFVSEDDQPCGVHG